MSRRLRIGLGLAWMLAACATLRAQERNYTIGGTVDLVSGGQNNRTAATLGAPPFGYFYAAYPSIRMSAAGARSSFDLSYTFGFDRTESDPAYQTESHGASFGFTSRLSPKWSLRLSESLNVTSDSATFNALRGVVPSDDVFRFLFDPVAVQRTSRSNSANFSASYAPTDKSVISFGASHSLRDYVDASSFGGSLSDQNHFSANVGYTRRTSTRDSWTFSYTGSYYTFDNFENAHSDTGSVGYSYLIGPDLNAQVSVGASQVRNLGSGRDYVGYNAAASLTKTLQSNSFSLYYSQQSGQPTGLGSVSDTRTAGLGWNRSIQGQINVSVSVSVFDAKRSLDNDQDTRGASAAASIGFPLSRVVSIQGGGQYQRYAETSLFGFTQKRVFVSLRLNEPNLWRFSK